MELTQVQIGTLNRALYPFERLGLFRAPCLPDTDLAGAHRNQLLAAILSSDTPSWQKQLERVDLPQGELLHEQGQLLSHAYFPISAVASLQCVTRDGHSVEIAVVGRDGFVGLPLLMSSLATSYSAIVQSAGQAYRISAQAMMHAFNRSDRVRHVLLQYSESVMAQTAQTAICNRHHSLRQQLCRRLLRGLDRVGTDQLTITHEAIAGMLGVRREGVTEAAGFLLDAGLIRYRRGHITILDRAGLEQQSCECYAADKAAYQRLSLTELRHRQ